MVSELFVYVSGTCSTESGDGFLFGGVLNKAKRSEYGVKSFIAKLVLFDICFGGRGLSIDVLGAQVVGID